jgi:hypothetical protein
MNNQNNISKSILKSESKVSVSIDSNLHSNGRKIWKIVSIILITIIVTFSVLFWYSFYLEKQNNLSQSISVDTKKVVDERKNDKFESWQNESECLGESHEYYNLGYGIENVYQGFIKPEKQVEITLSCDHKSLKIEGSVNQIIKSKDLSQYFNGKEIELADTISGSLVIELESDYNSDGYNDLTSIWSKGSGVSGISSALVFLYDDKNNIFVFNKELSFVNNLSVSPEGDLYTDNCYRNTEKDETYCSKQFYILNNEGKLEKIVSKRKE